MTSLVLCGLLIISSAMAVYFYFHWRYRLQYNQWNDWHWRRIFYQAVREHALTINPLNPPKMVKQAPGLWGGVPSEDDINNAFYAEEKAKPW